MAKNDPRRTVVAAKARACPICGKSAHPRHQPFCSARCANIDLGRWLKGNYRVETDETPDGAPERDDA